MKQLNDQNHFKVNNLSNGTGKISLITLAIKIMEEMSKAVIQLSIDI